MGEGPASLRVCWQSFSSSEGSSSRPTRGRLMTVAMSARLRPAEQQSLSRVLETCSVRRLSSRMAGSSLRRSSTSCCGSSRSTYSSSSRSNGMDACPAHSLSPQDWRSPGWQHDPHSMLLNAAPFGSSKTEQNLAKGKVSSGGMRQRGWSLQCRTQS